MLNIKRNILDFLKVIAGVFMALVALVFLGVGGLVGWVFVKAWHVEYSRPKFREGVSVYVDQVGWVRRELLSLPVPADVGYAETGDGCHVASGVLLLRSEKVRRVLSTIDDTVCNPAEDPVLRSIPAERLPRESRFRASAFWLERQLDGAIPSRSTSGALLVIGSAGGAIRIVEGDPWPNGFMINCSRDRKTYSLRTRLPDLLVGGSKYSELASVKFRRGSCMDRRHWPKIEALVDLIWSLEDYRPRETRESAKRR